MATKTTQTVKKTEFSVPLTLDDWQEDANRIAEMAKAQNPSRYGSYLRYLGDSIDYRVPKDDAWKYCVKCHAKYTCSDPDDRYCGMCP